MFVYIFCIVWATFFVFLAERQFKRIPTEVTLPKQKKSFLDFLRNLWNKIKDKQPEQASTEEAKNWKIATPSEAKHIEVVLDGNDEIAMIIPHIIKKSPKSNVKHKKSLDIQKVRSRIIKNNLPLNRGPASRKNETPPAQDIESNNHNDQAVIDDNNKEESISKPAANKQKPKVIVDKRPPKKHIKGKFKTKKAEKNSKPASKIVKHRRMVGGEVFREKKIEKIIYNVEKQETDKKVSSENIESKKKYISDVVRNYGGSKNGK